MLACSSLHLFFQDLGKEQKEEDILITLEDLPNVTVYFVCQRASLDCQNLSIYYISCSLTILLCKN